MANMFRLIFFTIIIGSVFAEDGVNNREPRHLKEKLCYKLGICGGGYQGGHGFQGGYGGYNGYQGGYPYPPINIGISQSQSSSSFGQGGYGSSNYPNNYQYNNGYNGYPHGYPDNGYPHNGYPNNGYNGYNNGYRPGYFGNGYGSYNNQFNGNYHGGPGGYGFQGPFGFNDDDTSEQADSKPIYEDYDGDNERSNKD